MSTILILSASTGHGHNQAANGLKNELETSGYKVRIVDPLREEGRVMDTIIEDGYSILANKLPKMYGRMYKMASYKLINKGLGTFLNLTLSRTIYELVQENKPDLLISTHPFYVNVVSFLKASRKIDLPFISVVTDYMAHQCYVNKFVDAYIVASRYTKDTLTEKGIIPSKIFTYGIPVRKEFREPRKAGKDDVFTMLVMGGGMGMSYIKNCLETICKNRHEFRAIVVCGKNEKLQHELEEKYSGYFRSKEIIIKGYCPNIPELMDRSDVIITKPGGLTVTEAINKNIPIVIPFFIPGQEEENTEILVKAGVAVRVNNSTELNALIDSFCENPSLLEKMRLKAQEISRDLSPDCIVQLSDRLIFDHKSQKTLAKSLQA